MAISVGQYVYECPASAGASWTTTAVTTPASGSTLLVFLTRPGYGGTSTVASDNYGNSWQLIYSNQTPGTGTVISAYIAYNANGGANHTFSITESWAGSGQDFHLFVITGAVLSAAALDSYSSSAPVYQPFDGPVVTSGSNELVISAVINQKGGPYAATGWTLHSAGGFSGAASISAPTAGTYNPAWTSGTAGNNGSVITVAIKQAPVPPSGTLAKTEGSDTLSASGNVPPRGTLSKTEDSDILNASGNAFLNNGTLAKTEGSDTLNASGFLPVTGTLAKTEGLDTLSASGSTAIPEVPIGIGAYQLTQANTPVGPGEFTTSGVTTAAAGSSFLVVISTSAYQDSPTLIRDNKGNSYTPLGSSTYQGIWITAYLKTNGAGGANHTVTYSYPNPSLWSVSVHFFEIVGGTFNSLLDQQFIGGDSTSPYTGSLPTTTNANDLLVSVVQGDSASSQNYNTSDSGWSFLSGASPSTDRSAAAYKKVTSIGTGYDPQWTNTVGSAAALATFAFKQAVNFVSATESPDTLSASGFVPVRGGVAKTENNDTLLASGVVPAIGSLAKTESSDTLSASGVIPAIGGMAKTEGYDLLLGTPKARTILYEDFDNFTPPGVYGFGTFGYGTQSGGVVTIETDGAYSGKSIKGVYPQQTAGDYTITSLSPSASYVTVTISLVSATNPFISYTGYPQRIKFSGTSTSLDYNMFYAETTGGTSGAWTATFPTYGAGYTGSFSNATNPIVGLSSDGGQFIYAQTVVYEPHLSADGSSELYVRFRAKMPSAVKHGLKFVKLFGYNPSQLYYPPLFQNYGENPSNYSNITFGLSYSHPTGVNPETGMLSVGYGDGDPTPSVGSPFGTVTNDTASGFDLTGSNPNYVGRSYGVTANVSVPNGIWSSSNWGTDWHLFEFYIKYNSGTSAENEVANGETLVRIDGVTYVDAKGIFNRHWSNGPITSAGFYGQSQGYTSGPFELWYDNIEITRGGFSTDTLNGLVGSISGTVVKTESSDSCVSTGTNSSLMPTPFFADNFSSGNFNSTDGGFSWGANTNCFIVNGFSPSGDIGNSVRFTLGIDTGGVSELRFNTGGTDQELWLSWYQYMPSGVETPGGIGPPFRGPAMNGSSIYNNKFFRLTASDPTKYPRFGAGWYHSTGTEVQVRPNVGIIPNSGGTVSWVGSAFDFLKASSRGRWVRVQFRCKNSTSASSPNGEIQAWVDGVDQGTTTGLDSYEVGNTGFNTGYLMGAVDTQWDNTNTYTYISNFAIARSASDPIPSTGTLIRTESADILSASGNADAALIPSNGTLSKTEGSDILSASGSITGSIGILIRVEGDDTLTADGYPESPDSKTNYVASAGLNSVSTLIPYQLPQFIRDDHPQFVAFLKKYYEFLEQPKSPIYEIKKFDENYNIDTASENMLAYFKSKILPSFPESTELSTERIIKASRDFYQKKGTPDSFKFLFRALYNKDLEIYLPKLQILRVSDGKWVQPQAFRLTLSTLNQSVDLNLLEKHKAYGSISRASCLIEAAFRTIDKSTNREIVEVYISNLNRFFLNGENIEIAYVDSNGAPQTFIEKVIGAISNIKINPNRRGKKYSVGDPVVINGGLDLASQTRTRAVATVGNVTTGSIDSATVKVRGYGFRPHPNSLVDIITANGVGANVIVTGVDTANGFTIKYCTDSIYDRVVPTTLLNSINFGFDNVVTSNINTTLQAAFSFQNIVLAPLTSVQVISGGAYFSETPILDAISLYDNDYSTAQGGLITITGFNTYNPSNATFRLVGGSYSSDDDWFIGWRVFVEKQYRTIIGYHGATKTVFLNRAFESNINETNILTKTMYLDARSLISNMGMIAAVKVINGGSGYSSGDTVTFTGTGYGAAATMSVTGGAITGVTLSSRGEGYPVAPSVAVTSVGGSGAILRAYMMSEGDVFDVVTSDIGQIKDFVVSNRGSDYINTPNVSLKVYDLNVASILGSESIVENDIVYQGANLNSTTFKAIVDTYYPANNILRLFNYSGSPVVGQNLVIYKANTANINTMVQYATVDGKIYPYQYGDGKAKANVEFLNGLIKYNGFYLNTDGHLSSDKKLQGNTKYQNFSYVIESEVQYNDYGKTIRDIAHPTGTQLYPTFLIKDTKVVPQKANMNVHGMILSSNSYIDRCSVAYNSNVVTGNALTENFDLVANTNDLIIINSANTTRKFVKTITGITSDTSLNIESSCVLTGEGRINVAVGGLLTVIGNTNPVAAYVTTNDTIRFNINDTTYTRLVTAVSGNTISMSSNSGMSTSNTNIVYEILPTFTDVYYQIIRTIT